MALRFRIVIAIAALILVLGLGGTLHARFTLSGISEDDLESRALAVSRDIEEDAGEDLLTNDIFGLYGRIRDTMANNDDIRYIVVLDADGTVRASTFPEGLPAGLREANVLAIGQQQSLRSITTSEGEVLDAAYPILDGKAGTVRVGFSKERLQGQVGRLTFRLLALTGGVLVAGLVVGYLLVTILTRPLSRLAEAARAVGRGELSQRIAVSGGDEVGQVAVAFNAMTEQLLAKEEERSQLLAKVIAAQEEERKRIARELHDEAGQALTSMLLTLKDIEERSNPNPAQDKISELRSLTTETLDLMRDMALELRPSTLDDLGLVAALERYVADFGRKHTLDTDFHSGSLEGTRLRPQTETALYRIAQEALTNVVRHANAGSVSVLLDRQDGHAILVVEDDGRGFEVGRVRHSGTPAQKLGLLGMEERAALIGGVLTIESQPGRTAVFVKVPMDGAGDGTDSRTDR